MVVIYVPNVQAPTLGHFLCFIKNCIHSHKCVIITLHNILGRTCEQRTKDIKCNDLCRITYKLILISSICIYSKTHPIFTDGYSFQDNEIIVINVRHNNNISKKLCFFLQFNIHFLSCMLSKYQFKRYLIISK